MSVPLLTLMIAVPAVGAFAIMLSDTRAQARATALVATLVTFGLSVWLLVRFQPVAGFQLQETADWIPAWGITYQLSIDGVSLLLVLLTAFIYPIVVLGAWEQTLRAKGFFASLLGLEAALIGVFCATDLILFYVFFEVMLVPMYGLIGVWGGQGRRYAAVKFFLYTLIGGLLMLAAVLYLYFEGGAQSFAYRDLLQVPLTPTEQIVLFLCFFIAFAIKVPLFPVHTWLPDAHTEAPTAGSVVLAAVMLKIGGYGFLRYSLPMFPQASVDLAPLILVLGLVGILYGALVSTVQRDIKRLVAYSSVAHMGFVVIGVFGLTNTGASASLVQMVNHGLSTGALFLLVGFLYDRAHSRMIADYSGLLRATPIFGGLFLVTVMSSIALPGLNGFVGEFPIMLGTYLTYPWAAVAAAFGVILAALYLLWAYQRMFHGPVEGRATGLADLGRREIGVMVPIVILMVAIGLYPKPLYDRVNPTVDQIVETVRSRAEGEPTAVAGTRPAAVAETAGAAGGEVSQ